MRLPSFKRIFKADYQEEFQQLIETLSYNINSGFEAIYEAINKRLTLRDNILCSVKDVELQVNSEGIPLLPVNVPLDMTNRIDGVVVLKAENIINITTYPTSGVFVNYTQTESGITINHVTGLQASTRYRLRIVAFGI